MKASPLRTSGVFCAQAERVAQEEAAGAQQAELAAQLEAAAHAAADAQERAETELAQALTALEAERQGAQRDRAAAAAEHEAALAALQARLDAAEAAARDGTARDAERLREAEHAASEERTRVEAAAAQLAAAQESLAHERSGRVALEERLGRLESDLESQREQVRAPGASVHTIRALVHRQRTVQTSASALQAQAAAKECAELRGKLSGAEAARAEAREAVRTVVRREQEVERLKEDLGDAHAQAAVLRERLEEAEAAHAAVRSGLGHCFASRTQRRGPKGDGHNHIRLQEARRAEGELAEVQAALADAQAEAALAGEQVAQARHELEMERDAAQSQTDAAQFYRSLIGEIQDKIAGSRPGSAASARTEALVADVRQSLGATPALTCYVRSVQQCERAERLAIAVQTTPTSAATLARGRRCPRRRRRRRRCRRTRCARRCARPSRAWRRRRSTRRRTTSTSPAAAASASRACKWTRRCTTRWPWTCRARTLRRIRRSSTTGAACRCRSEAPALEAVCVLAVVLRNVAVGRAWARDAGMREGMLCSGSVAGIMQNSLAVSDALFSSRLCLLIVHGQPRVN